MNNIPSILLQKKAVLWDFDGCFCDSEQIHFDAYEQAFKMVGHSINKDEYFETFTHTGGGIAKEIENHNLTCDLKEVAQYKKNFYFDLISAGKAKLFPEIPEIIALLNQMNIKSVIASNSSNQEIELILSKLDEKVKLENIFGLVPGLRKKPFPDIFNHAIKQLNIAPNEALVIEDSERGLYAAKDAQCDALWIKTYLTDRFHSNAPYLAKISHEEFLSLLRSMRK